MLHVYIDNLHTRLHSGSHRLNRDWRVPRTRNDVHALLYPRDVNTGTTDFYFNLQIG